MYGGRLKIYGSELYILMLFEKKRANQIKKDYSNFGE